MASPHTEYRWSATGLPTTHLLKAPTALHGFDFTAAMLALCRDLVKLIPDFAAIDMSRVLVTAAISRNRSKYGLQARVTPLRFRDGALTTRRRGTFYGVPRYFVGNFEIKYLLTFILPRFLNQSFEEKLTTVVHELFHFSPVFDGDIRRLGGRCCIHSKSKKGYDAKMLDLARQYLKLTGQASLSDFLKWNFDDFQKQHGGVCAVIVPRPRLVPISER